jgi:hypothetical protein
VRQVDYQLPAVKRDPPQFRRKAILGLGFAEAPMATTAQQPAFDLRLLLLLLILLGAVSGALDGTAECGWMRLFIDSACCAATLVTTAPLATSWRFPRGAEYSLRHGTGAEHHHRTRMGQQH